MIEPTGYWATYVPNSDKSGMFNVLKNTKRLFRKNIVEHELLVKPNDTVASLYESHEKNRINITNI